MVEGIGRRSSRRGVARGIGHTYRHGVSIDLTPMVDVAFLLLTFFMLTTSLLRHQAIEVQTPRFDDPPVSVPVSNVLIIRVNELNECFWNIGTAPPRPIRLEELRSMLLENQQAHDKLVTILKVDRRAKYRSLVDMLDEIQLTRIGRFSIVPMDEHDREMLRNVSSGKGA